MSQTSKGVYETTRPTARVTRTSACKLQQTLCLTCKLVSLAEVMKLFLSKRQLGFGNSISVVRILGLFLRRKVVRSKWCFATKRDAVLEGARSTRFFSDRYCFEVKRCKEDIRYTYLLAFSSVPWPPHFVRAAPRPLDFSFLLFQEAHHSNVFFL